METRYRAFTLASYRVKDGQEEAFLAQWDHLARMFSSLPDPPLWGALIRHMRDRSLFYSFGPWRSEEHVHAMRDSPVAAAEFAKLQAYCVAITPGEYEIVKLVEVEPESV